MLIGQYDHTLDEKNRLTLPAKFRDAFADGVVLTRGMEGCVYAYTREAWDRLAAAIAARDPLSPEARLMRRFFFSGAALDEPDRQGRVTVPAPLIERAGLRRDVVVAGVYDHVEIWDRDAWRDQLKRVEGSAEDVAERLAAANV